MVNHGQVNHGQVVSHEQVGQDLLVVLDPVSGILGPSPGILDPLVLNHVVKEILWRVTLALLVNLECLVNKDRVPSGTLALEGGPEGERVPALEMVNWVRLAIPHLWSNHHHRR